MPKGYRNLDKLCEERAESPGKIIDVMHICGEKIHDHPDRHICRRNFCDYSWPVKQMEHHD